MSPAPCLCACMLQHIAKGDRNVQNNFRFFCRLIMYVPRCSVHAQFLTSHADINSWQEDLKTGSKDPVAKKKTSMNFTQQSLLRNLSCNPGKTNNVRGRTVRPAIRTFA